MKEAGVLTFILLFFLIVVAFYVGFSWDVLAFAGASTRAIREFTFPQDFTKSTSSSSSNPPTVNL